ncbi:MAG TPA: hypothetical protein DDY13_04480 [Cytophagales bacterium]|jgi:putative peptide zinc metalloprotease protein|nr:hypothetical protein [Cytophagales bacterium]
MISQAKEQSVPHLDENLEILPFNQVEYLVQHKTLNYQVNINSETYQLLKLIDGKKSISLIKDEYKSKHDIDISMDFIHSLLYNKLARFGIIKQNDFEVEKRKKASYLRLSFIFLPSHWVKKITPLLAFLFNKTLFFTLLFVMTAFITTMIASNYSVISSNSSNLLSLNLLLYIITFHFGSIFHELGHATACSKFGAKLGGIGFGFYIFFPVLFADVSDAWRLPKSQRIIVNLGGLYFEMIIATILLIIYLFNHQTPYLVIPCVLMIHTLYNLNPLIKYDGYWVLSDATDTPNLHEKSFTRLKSLLKRFFLKVKGYKFEKKDLFLVTYGFMSVSFIFFFLAMALIIDPDSVIKLPINLFNYINDNSNITLQGLGQFFLPAIFWILVVKMVIQGIIKIIRKQKIRKKTALA